MEACSTKGALRLRAKLLSLRLRSRVTSIFFDAFWLMSEPLAKGGRSDGIGGIGGIEGIGLLGKLSLGPLAGTVATQ